MHRDEWASIYDQKCLTFTLLYVICYHVSDHVGASWRGFLGIKQAAIAAIVLLALYGSTAARGFSPSALEHGHGQVLQLGLEVALCVSMAGLVFCVLSQCHPSWLSWLGQQSFFAYVLHAYLGPPPGMEPETALRIFHGHGAGAGALQLAVVLAYPIGYLFLLGLVKHCCGSLRK